MSKFSSIVRYIPAVPRSQRRKKSGSATSVTISAGSSSPSTPMGVVDLVSAQIIRGLKNFADGLSVGASPAITYDEATKSFVLDGNLIITGEMAMRAILGDLDIPTIMDAIVVDQQTLIVDRSSGSPVLKLNPDLSLGGGGGITEDQLREYVASVLLSYATKTYVDEAIASLPSGGGGGITENDLANYLTTNKYTTQTWVSENRWIKPVRTVASSTTLTASDYMVVITASTRVTITLPTNSVAVKGQSFEIFGRNSAGMILTANRTIYRAQGANTTSHTITAGYFHAMVTYDGSYWLLSITENS